MRNIHENASVEKSHDKGSGGHGELKASHKILFVKSFCEASSPSLHQYISIIVENSKEEKRCEKVTFELINSEVEALFRIRINVIQFIIYCS